MTLRILYRGPLSSCNYGCTYCPFAKTRNTRHELAWDKAALHRFAAWAVTQPTSSHRRDLGLFFTPWGEALIRSYYRDTLTELTQHDHIHRVAIQTNLSGPTDWLANCAPGKLALWATWHPQWASMQNFLDKVNQADHHKARISVGVVGQPYFIDQIEALRQALPDHIYLWINAVKKDLHTLPQTIRARFSRIDPLYEHNTKIYDSQGHPCHAGEDSLSVRGNGDAWRCHFLPTPIGNLYEPGWDKALQERECTAASCRCHIGYVHLKRLNLRHIYQEGILERIPAPTWRHFAAKEAP